ncbi:hypothetical protein LTR60_000641, partial [Cryomyces antarcticus]
MAHPRRHPTYDDDVDFAALALHDADFANFLDKKSGKLDFQDPKAVQQLTKSLLKRDFGLTIQLPDDRLCPPVPVRYNYIRWIQDLLDTTSDNYTDRYDPDREIIGLDVGTGASCIYPLLGTAARPHWRFHATETDDLSYTFARANITSNSLHSRIRLHHTQLSAPLLPLDSLEVSRLDFCMCNPPFYSSRTDMAASAASKSLPPLAVCTGAESEMVCEGGDVGFVLRIVDESCLLQSRVQWYTSMLGKLSSVDTVVARLKEVGVANWAVGALRAGAKTRRWVVGWSWQDRRPRNDVARHPQLPLAVQPFPTSYTIPILHADVTCGLVHATLDALDLRWQWRPSIATGVGFAKANVWSRAARRKAAMFARQRNNNTTDPARTLAPASEPVKAMHDGKKAEAEDREMQEAGAEDGEKDDDDDDDDDSSDADNDPVALGFKITVGAADKVVE